MKSQGPEVHKSKGLRLPMSKGPKLQSFQAPKKSPKLWNHSIPLKTPSTRAWLWSSSYLFSLKSKSLDLEIDSIVTIATHHQQYSYTTEISGDELFCHNPSKWAWHWCPSILLFIIFYHRHFQHNFRKCRYQFCEKYFLTDQVKLRLAEGLSLPFIA